MYIFKETFLNSSQLLDPALVFLLLTAIFQYLVLSGPPFSILNCGSEFLGSYLLFSLKTVTSRYYFYFDNFNFCHFLDCSSSSI